MTRHTNDRARAQGGFTLLEVMLAMTILGVGVLTIGLAQLSAIRVSSRSEHMSQAAYLAQEQLEVFMAMPITNPFFAIPVVMAPDPGGPIDIDPTDQDLTTYNRFWTVEPNTPAAGLTRVTVFVDWNNASRAGPNRVQLQGVKG